MLPTRSDLHVNALLTNTSIAFFQDAASFISSRVFPIVPSTKQSDLYVIYDKGDFNRNQAKKRAPGTRAPSAGYRVDTTPSFFCDVKALRREIPDQIRNNADPVFNLDREATEFLTHQMLIEKEVDFVSTFMTGGVWTYDYDGVSGSPSTNQVRHWSDYTNSDPISDIRNAKIAVKQATGYTPNKLTLGEEVYNKLVDHPDILERFKGGATMSEVAVTNRVKLAQILELDEVIVAGAIQNTAAEGQTASHSFIAGKKALLTYSPPRAGLYTPSAGYTFVWTGQVGTGSNGFRIKKYYVDELASDVIESEAAYDHKLVSSELGAFWDTVIA